MKPANKPLVRAVKNTMAAGFSGIKCWQRPVLEIMVVTIYCFALEALGHPHSWTSKG